jgi:hypothetical protein
MDNVVQLMSNLDERRLQQRIASGALVAPAAVRSTIAHIKTAGNIAVVLALAFVVVGSVWSAKRRPRRGGWVPSPGPREPSLRKVTPVLWWSALALAVASLVISLHASSLDHAAATPSAFATYRGYLALGDAVRVVLWTAWAVLIVRATGSGRGAVLAQEGEYLARGHRDVGARTEHRSDAGIT